LLEQLRKEGKMPLLGKLATPLMVEPTLTMSNGRGILQLAFGLYKVPATQEGESIILDAICAGYRHFDTAAFYANKATSGRALRRSILPRDRCFITSKIWNDAQKKGRAAVRESVEESLESLDFRGYFDVYLVHWPVPGHFVETYKELKILHDEGKLHNLGLSNFSPEVWIRDAVRTFYPF
jgi:diketogulonate reductase-like aldo/keto reductase